MLFHSVLKFFQVEAFKVLQKCKALRESQTQGALAAHKTFTAPRKQLEKHTSHCKKTCSVLSASYLASFHSNITAYLNMDHTLKYIQGDNNPIIKHRFPHHSKSNSVDFR